MDKAELLEEFKAKVDEFAKYQGFISKTRQQAEKFAKAVVDKVIADNLEKRDAVVAELIPLTSDVDDVIGELEEEKQGILEGQSDSRLALEEMELRKTIGELSEADFDKESKGLQDELSKTDEKIASIDEELETFRSEMERWEEIGSEAGVLAGSADEDQLVQIEADEEVPEIESVDILEPDADVAEEVEAFQGSSGEEGVRFEQVNQVDDVSVVFAEDEDEADDLRLEVGDVDTLLDEDLESVEEPADDRPRRAVMLYQEGTAEEQIHPFTGDVLTLGRGRDNDIQVKNDSKVSRYHCKLYRKNGNFYIEDNKSANGTLVNGELITERRLFGGEEIIIGETFFRFRIMD